MPHDSPGEFFVAGDMSVQWEHEGKGFFLEIATEMPLAQWIELTAALTHRGATPKNLLFLELAHGDEMENELIDLLPLDDDTDEIRGE